MKTQEEIDQELQAEADRLATTNLTSDPPNPVPASPAAPADNSREVLSAYQEELRQQATRNRELQTENDRLRAGPPKTAEQESQEFFSNPREAMRAEISSAVKPLNDFVAAQNRANIIAQIKQNMRQASGFEHLDKVENLFDQYLSQYAQLDVNIAVASYNAAVGRFVAVNGANALITPDTRTKPVLVPDDNSNRNAPVNNNPPHIRPSPPPVNAPVNQPGVFKLPRPLTENEKKLARFNKMTDEDWWKETYEVQPSEVVREVKK